MDLATGAIVEDTRNPGDVSSVRAAARARAAAARARAPGGRARAASARR